MNPESPEMKAMNELQDRVTRLEIRNEFTVKNGNGNGKKPKERNSEGLVVALLIIAATFLAYCNIISGVEWSTMCGAIGLGYAGLRTQKKVTEIKNGNNGNGNGT